MSTALGETEVACLEIYGACILCICDAILSTENPLAMHIAMHKARGAWRAMTEVRCLSNQLRGSCGRSRLAYTMGRVLLAVCAWLDKGNKPSATYLEL